MHSCSIICNWRLESFPGELLLRFAWFPDILPTIKQALTDSLIPGLLTRARGCILPWKTLAVPTVFPRAALTFYDSLELLADSLYKPSDSPIVILPGITFTFPQNFARMSHAIGILVICAALTAILVTLDIGGRASPCIRWSLQKSERRGSFWSWSN